jgi:hypothetical protein
MPLLRAGRPYEPGLDVRDRDDLVALVQGALPHGVLWPLLAVRRAGKTWTLKALERRLGPSAACVLDLRHDGPKFDAEPPGPCLLIDEPGARLGPASAVKFIRRCAVLRDQGIKVLVT